MVPIGADLLKRFTMPGEPPFDPYYTWLGIPPDESAGGPNCYRLLGLRLFEPNPNVIENAADRQMMHLRSLQIGAHAIEAQRLLNEVAAARVTLLDPARREAYDHQLHRSLAPPPAPQPPIPSKLVSPKLSEPRPARRTPRGSALASAVSNVWTIVGGIAGLALGVLIVFYFTGRDMLGFAAKSRPANDQLADGGPASAKPTPPDSPPPAPAPATTTPPSPPPKTLPQPPTPEPSPSPFQEPTTPKSELPSRPATPDSRLAAPGPRSPSPDLAPAPIAETSKPDPFGNVPRARRIPPLISSEPAPLMKLAREPTEPLQVTVHSSAANLPANSSIVAEADPQGRGWILYFLNDAAAETGKITLAIIRREGLELSFAWTVPHTDSELRRQVANCIVEFADSKDSRLVQLREPVTLEPLVLDLEKDTQAIDIDVPDPPPASKLVFRIHELKGFARGGKLRGGATTFPITRPAIIEFDEVRGAEVELRLLRMATSGKFTLRVEPVFREGSNKEFDLTLPRLDKFKDALEASLAKAQAEIPVLQKNLSAAKTTLRNLQGRQSSNIQEEAVRRPQIVAAAALVDRTSQRIARLQKQAAESQARLAAVPEMRSFIQSLHKNATVKFAICADLGDKELLLVDAQSSPAPQGSE
jgi:hypothetical protein